MSTSTIHGLRSTSGIALVVLTAFVMPGCDQPPLAVDTDVLFDELPQSGDGGGGEEGGGYDTSYNYGSHTHTYNSVTMAATDADVDDVQVYAHADDPAAFDPNQDWSDPNAEIVASWPAAYALARAATSGARYLARAARQLTQTTAIRNGVVGGARYARDVTAAAAAGLMVVQFPIGQYEEPEDIPVEEFEFIFDYASQ